MWKPLIILILLLPENVKTQPLSALNIKKELTENANVIIRNSILTFEVINEGTAIETVHTELTILNESGKRESTQYVYYSDLQSIISFSGEIYDKYGKRVKKIKKSEIEDVSASGGNMYTDSRLKVLDFAYPSYPYSIVFDYKVKHSGLMFYPYWMPQESSKTAIEKASLIVKVSESIGLNIYENKVKGDKIRISGLETYTWEVKDLNAFTPEPYSPPFRQLVPFVMLSPKVFEMEGYKGSMTDWKSIGLYENKLLKNRNELPEEAMKEIKEAVEGITNIREKTKRVYEYVQNNTRYVSVQLGIGGWQPYDATYVYENGYGDCKALSNYTYSLLKHVGIPSIYSNVYAGQGKPNIVTEFPNSRFNHIILAVPMERDTIWLECTSQTNPFGYLGYFTSDRNVLLITDEGGKLAKTPTYTKIDNTQIRVVEANISKSGKATASITTEFAGLQYENVDIQLHHSAEDQKKWLMQNYNIKKTGITEFNYEHYPGPIPKIKESVSLVSEGFGTITGNRIFFEVNPLNKLSSIPKKLKERKNDIVLKTAFTDIDSINYKLPEGFHVEYLPENVHIKNQFGEYQTTYIKTKEGMLYVRKFISEKGRYPSSDYEAFRAMRKEISKSDRAKIVLVGST